MAAAQSSTLPRLQASNLLGLSSHSKGYPSGAEEKYRQQSYTTVPATTTRQRSSSSGAISYQPQVVYSAPTTATRPTLPHHPASFMAALPAHSANRYAYVTTASAPTAGGAVMMVPAGQAYVATQPAAGVPRVSSAYSTAPSAVQRIRREAGVALPPRDSHGGGYHRSSASESAAVRQRRDQSAPPPGSYVPRHPTSAPDSDSSDGEPYSAHTSGYGSAIPQVPRGMSSNNTGGSAAPRPIMRKRTQSSASMASVHFTPDNLFLTFPTPHSFKLSNIPKFGSQSLMRAIREKVITMWLPGISFQKEGRGEYVVGFSGLMDGAMDRSRGDTAMLSESERKNWGIWTARGSEGIAALRLLTNMFVTFAAQGFSYLASMHTLPPQIIFTTTPADTQSRFLAMEVSISPLHSKKARVPVTDPDSGEFILERKVKIDASHVRIRCVDFPEDILRSVIRAMRNTGRDGAGINSTVKQPRKSTSTGGKEYETDAEKYSSGASELLEFGVQGEKWETKGVYVLDSVISRGTGKRAVTKKELSRARAEKAQHPNMPSTIESDTDTLPVMLSQILKSLSSSGFRLESSIPLPLPVPLVDPFSPFGSQTHGGGIGSFISGVLHGDTDGMSRKGHGREVWIFRSVGWFEDIED